MNATEVSSLRNIWKLAAIAAAALLVSCGSSGDDTTGADNTDSNGSEPMISAAPALLNRSCDGAHSPQLFCPSINGG